VRPTLARGRLRVPYRALGQHRALHVHDRLVARRLPGLAASVDIVHTWPSGALETLRAAGRLGIPTVLERPNAHTRYAYTVVERESERLGVPLPPGSEHAFDADVLRREEEEFRLADGLLCPSEFVVRTFVDEGFPPGRLVRHAYGFDDAAFFPGEAGPRDGRPFTALFVGFAAVRKGLHFALEAWLDSAACRDGTFRIAGDMLPAYRSKLAGSLAHPSVEVLGHRTDVPELMRQSDVLLLPSIEEGSPLVALEAIGSGCVPLVSDVCEGPCRHMENALVHRIGDVAELSKQLTLLRNDPAMLAKLRAGAISSAPGLTWKAAGQKLLDAYLHVIRETAGRVQVA
jgi:glycosyltransferase involved in cell wall biosynthesis